MVPFCSFCNCNQCRNGSEGIYHAKTTDGRWVCSICYEIDICSRGNPNGPCDDLNCIHRPKIVSEWIKYSHKIVLVT